MGRKQKQSTFNFDDAQARVSDVKRLITDAGDAADCAETCETREDCIANLNEALEYCLSAADDLRELLGSESKHPATGE